MNTQHTLPTITLKTERTPGHPWVWSAQVHKPSQPIRPGSVVEVVDAKQRFVGRGFWNSHARIALRLLSKDPDTHINDDWITRQIQNAVQRRRTLLQLDQITNAWRVVHSEGDGLGGLIVDRYADVLVIEYFAAGMWRFRDAIHTSLNQAFPGAKLYWFAQKHVQKQESFDCRSTMAPSPVQIQEHGQLFHAVPGCGHKTGFFADQRDNRQRFAKLAYRRNVLDLCCNSGGFAIHAMAAGAHQAHGVDLDSGILEIASDNARVNQLKVHFEQADIFDWLRAAKAKGARYDAIVLDPARLTRDRHQVPAALKKYFAMNRLVLDVMPPGGLLLTCSCSGLVSQDQFIDMLRRVAANAARRIRILEIHGASADHPVSVDVPENRYLKAVYCQVE